MAKAVFLLLVPLLVLIGLPIYCLFLKSPPPLPDIDTNAWWGPEKLKQKQNTNIKDFKIKFTELIVTELQRRLRKHATFTPPLEGVAFEYGFNSDIIENWITYWREEYPFEEREKFLNQFPQYKTNIQGLNIHFLRIKPDVPQNVEVVPMLLLHGWPGSVREFYEAIPLLTEVSKDRDFAIEVIIPSLPGYGFSDAAIRPGLSTVDIAVIFRNLMHRLGHNKFYVQGGDWGAIIGSNLATFFPDEVLGYHSNMAFSTAPAATIFSIIGSFYPPLVVEPEYADRMYPLSKFYAKLLEELGYLHIQATKPDTIGIALTDSPSGLLAYILEKFSSWTNMEHRSKKDGALEFRFTKEQLIDNLMFYWVPRSITTSMRLYAENFNKRLLSMNLDQIPTPVPSWFIQAKHEVAYLPAWIIRWKYQNLQNVTVIDDGGHFLALELPELFSKDVLKAVAAFRNFHKQNKAKTEL
ncbi:juvenile hormone epoxide hydrolase-like [Achroia grisella]|uniref:juvenile hormone epoxide hydrolase-like n=1 Tax=Achroia grisella TaxID=688607 RepID=UPI0027D32764|nr:juvenile hormone epoxide hydrolase-like [Achroia grisella]